MLSDLEGITQRLYFVKFKFNQGERSLYSSCQTRPIGGFLGNFAEVSATELGAAAIKGTIDWVNIDSANNITNSTTSKISFNAARSNGIDSYFSAFSIPKPGIMISNSKIMSL